MTEKIFARHAGLDKVVPGQLIKCKLDLVLGNDITSPPAITEFNKIGKPVFDKNKIALVPDHFTPNKDIKSAQMAKIVREFARKHEIVNYFEVGQMGIEHVILPEKGLVAPGDLIIGADSHTCTYGAVGAFATGVGSTDMGAAMATGETWFKVPAAIKVELTGKMPQYVTGKDVILTLIGMIGVDGARYQSLEFCGDGIANLSMTDRLTIANMAIEAGAKNGIFPVDDITKAYIKDRVTKPYEIVEADADAKYDSVVKINLAELLPVVALPHLPENVKNVKDIAEIKIDQVVIGSCTNGRIEDFRAFTEIVKGRKKADNVTAWLVPGSHVVESQIKEEGLLDILTEAGFVLRQPGCSACLAMNDDKVPAGKYAVSTSNRNFEGRQGPGSRTLLASPIMAAAAAVTGVLTDPRELM